MSSIDPVSASLPVAPASRTHRVSSAGGVEKTGKSDGFGEALDSAIGDVDELSKKADRTALGLTTGEVEDVHQVMIAMNEADLSFRMMLEVRNRLVDAYKEISRLQM